MKNKSLLCTKDWCIKNRQNLIIPVSATLMVAGVIGTYNIAPSWQLPLAIWIAAIIIPLILGMAEKIRFRWVILWEIVMMFPIGLIVALFFGGAIIGLFKRSY